MRTGLKSISVIIPVYNDEALLEDCYRTVTASLKRDAGKAFSSYEIIFVDDGSKDSTASHLLRCAENDQSVSIIQLDQNYGQHAALAAGFERATGEIIITLDSDLQISPAEIPRLIGKLDEGYELVSGVRLGRKDSFIFRTIPSRIFNRLVSHMTGVHLRDWGCPTVALEAPLAKRLLKYGDMRRFLKPLGIKLARSAGEVEVRHHPRQKGSSNYGLLDLIDLALDFITNFSRRPFQKLSLLGSTLFGLGVLSSVLYPILRFPLGVPLGGRTQVVIFFAVVVGLQFMILGFLGEFIIRIYRKQNGIPFYSIRAIHAAGRKEK